MLLDGVPGVWTEELAAAEATSVGSALLSTRSVRPVRGAPTPAIVRGHGSYLTDASGQDYLDAGCGSGSMILGHGDARASALLSDQARALAIFPSRHMTVQVVEDYARALVAYAGGEFSRATFFSSGSDAVEGALKLALQYHQLSGAPRRCKVLGREASYHGNSLAGLAVGGFIRRRRPYESALSDHARASAIHSPEKEDAEARQARDLASAQTFEAAILAEGPETVAGIILEPISGAALSAATPGPSYLRHIREICDRYGILLIADEVMSGFGRSGRHFAVNHWDCQPDILVMGKAISAGYYPLSGLLLRSSVAGVFEQSGAAFQNAHTHACNPVGCSIGLHVLERLREERLEDRSAEVGQELRQLLENEIRSPWRGEVRGKGLFVGVQLGAVDLPAPEGLSDLLQKVAVSQGLLIYGSSGSPGSESGEHFLLLPPLNITARDVTLLVERLGSAFQEIDRLVPTSRRSEGAI